MARRLRLLTTIIFMCLGFCLLEAAVSARFFASTGFSEALLHPDPRGVYLRLVGCGLIVLSWVLQLLTVRRHQHLDTALQAGEELYRNLVENCPDGIVVHRQDRLLYVNPMGLAVLGRSQANDLLRLSLQEIIHPEDWPASAQKSAAVLGGSPAGAPSHLRIMLPGGTRRDIMTSSARIIFEGSPAVLTFCRDVTRDLANRADLAASRERLSLALEAAQDGAWDWDMVNDQRIYNQAWYRMLGREETLQAQPAGIWSELVHPDDQERADAALAAHLGGQAPSYEVEVRLRHKDGHYLWILDRGRVVERGEDGAPRRMAGTHRDITVRKNAQMALAVRNRIAEAFLTSPRDAVFPNVLALISEALESPTGVLSTFDAAGRLQVAAHDGAAAAHPRPEVTVLTREDLPPEWIGMLDRRLAAIVNGPLPMKPLARDLQRSVSVPVISRDQVLGFVTVADRPRDYDEGDMASLTSLTGYLAPILGFHLENLAKEGQLRQAQKMEAIGALAGGIAHDFNNILQAILGFSTLALEEARTLETRPGGFIANDLERVVRATQRGRDLVNRIRLFGRREPYERQPTDIVPLIAETVDLLKNMIPATIRVRAEVTGVCPPVMTDPTQISQMLVNLATNAFHAMEHTGGELVFGLRPIGAGPGDQQVPTSLAGQDLVELTVIDTGCGMDAATLGRLYDPFFTTKEVGKGTGLGLSVVHGIVTSHHGEIVVESVVGVGTTVHVYLPCHGVPAASAADLSPAAPAVVPDPVQTGRRILFLDDEQDIVDLARALLEKQGHFVEAVIDPQVALRQLQRPGAEFDLLITDLTMPRMTGIQFAAQVEQVRPDLPIIVITGMNEATVEDWRAQPGIRGLLRKPFSGNALSETIARVLNEDYQGAAEAPDLDRSAKRVDATARLADDQAR